MSNKNTENVNENAYWIGEHIEGRYKMYKTYSFPTILHLNFRNAKDFLIPQNNFEVVDLSSRHRVI